MTKLVPKAMSNDDLIIRYWVIDTRYQGLGTRCIRTNVHTVHVHIVYISDKVYQYILYSTYRTYRTHDTYYTVHAAPIAHTVRYFVHLRTSNAVAIQ